VAIADDATVNVDYKTLATIKSGADILTHGTLALGARTATNADSNAYASGLGFGADGHGHANSQVGNNGNGAYTTATIEGTAGVIANAVAATSDIGAVQVGNGGAGTYIVPGLRVYGHSEAYGAGFYSEGIDNANAESTTNTDVVIGASADVKGLEGVDLRTHIAGVDTNADSFARSTGLFGYVSATATNNTYLNTKVDGAAGALITAGPRSAGDVARLMFDGDIGEQRCQIAPTPVDRRRRHTGFGRDLRHRQVLALG